MDATLEGDRAAERIFIPRRPTDTDLSGKAGMDMLSWYARTVADPAEFRLKVSFVIFDDLAVFRLTHSRSVLDRTDEHVTAVSLGSVLYVVCRGPVVLSQNGKDVSLGQGASALLPGTAAHQLRVPEGAEILLIVVRKGVFHGRGVPEPPDGLRPLPATSYVTAVSQFLQSLAVDLPAPSSPDGITSQHAILHLLTGLVAGAADAPAPSAQHALWIARAQTFIAGNYANPNLTTAAVATATGISSRHLQRVFALAGASVAGELRRTRTRWAATWLEDSGGTRTLSDVAALAGFGTVSRMRRAFRYETGLTPPQYRAASVRDEAPKPTWNPAPSSGEPEVNISRRAGFPGHLSPRLEGNHMPSTMRPEGPVTARKDLT